MFRQYLLKAFLLASFALVYLNVNAQSQMLAMQPTSVVHSENRVNETTVTTINASRKKLLTYLKQLKAGDDQQEYQSSRKFYYHLANVLARLRLYPLALKCFLKTVPLGDNTDSTELSAAYLDPNSFDDRSVNSQPEEIAAKSKEITYQHIAGIFNDGKMAVAYAMLFHVKQPVAGKRKIFVLNNTGHTFITLIKYNADSTYNSASFGFYPKKDHLLSATPLAPVTSSVFKDDAGHGWDEVIGKLISKRKFEKILKLTADFSMTEYDLNNNNCTDFGLQAATLAGLYIADTKGSWPLGRGNTPGITGQALLDGKVTADTDIAQVLTLTPQ